jgi:hypothetical protein
MNRYYGQKVTVVEAQGDYRLRVTFADGFGGDVDLAPLLGRGPIYEPLRDVGFFQKVKVSPEWGGWNGERTSTFRLERFGRGARQANSWTTTRRTLGSSSIPPLLRKWRERRVNVKGLRGGRRWP